MKDTPFHRFKRFVRRTMLSMGIYGPLLRKVVRSAEVYGPKNENAEYTLLALKPERFRGDLDILAEQFGFRILKLKKGWQQKLLELHWESGFSLQLSYYYPEQGTQNMRIQQRVRSFLRRFLPMLLEELKIDCVLGASTYYLDDWDYANVLHEMRFPYVVIYRECLQASDKNIQFQKELTGRLRSFKGSHLLLHNEVTRKAFIDAEYVEPERVSAPGCMRMDPFIQAARKQAEQPRQASGRRKRATLFSFVHCSGLPHIGNDFIKERDKGFVKLFDETHVAFIKLAVEHPEIDFVLKPKWGAGWIDEMQIPLTPHGIDIRKVENLRILPEADAQQVILDSDVVIGFGSTTLLEAGIAARAVIIPHFAEAVEKEYEEYVLLRGDYDAFDIATSPEHLRKLVLKRLEDPVVPDDVLQRRNDVFERYVSPLRGDASEKYAEIIKQVIGQG
jgi:hypothetical protein